MRRPLPHRLWRVFTIAFLLNALWETAQLPAYEGMDQIPIWGHIVGGGISTLLDALFIAAVYLALRRAQTPPLPTYILAAACGAATAVLVEHLALSLGWWSYTALMPVIPYLDAGLFPFLQLTLLTPLTLRLS